MMKKKCLFPLHLNQPRLLPLISVVALTSVIGNILVITTFFKTQNLRISTNYYITSMAVFDLLFIISNWPLYLCSRLSIFGHSVSSFQCKLGNYLTSVSYSVSVESLVLVTVDRFIAIVFPMKVSMISGRIRAVFITLTWIIPGGILVPYSYLPDKKNLMKYIFARQTQVGSCLLFTEY